MPMLRCRSGLLSLLLLAASGPQVVEGDSVLEILGSLKSFRDAGVDSFKILASELKKHGQDEDAQKARKWSDDWLSVLGLNKGLTGLAKDFVMNYLGRGTYHDKNGALIDSIKRVAHSFPEAGEDFDEDSLDDVHYYLRKVCKEGKILFAEGGSLNQMLTELVDILETKGVSSVLSEAMKGSDVVKQAFGYFAGSPPRISKTAEL